MNATDRLVRMLDRMYRQAREAGATEEQALSAVRALWIEAVVGGKGDA